MRMNTIARNHKPFGHYGWFFRTESKVW